MYGISKNVILTAIILSSIIISTLTLDRRIITSLKYSKYRVKPTIVNGTAAPEGKFPYLVSIKKETAVNLWKNICGGSIIKPTTVLTAAHCFDWNNFFYLHNIGMLRIVAGSLNNFLIPTDNSTDNNEEQWREIKTVTLHEYFIFPLNDIALVVVDSPFIYTAAVNEVVPARRTVDYSGPCYTAGFGRTESGFFPATKLLWGEINLMSRMQCRFVWSMDMDSFICSKSILADVSVGDSGGPLVCTGTLEAAERDIDNPVLVGVVSGKNYDKSTLYTRVSTYIDWIDRNGSRNHSFNIVIVLGGLSKYILFYLDVSI